MGVTVEFPNLQGIAPTADIGPIAPKETMDVLDSWDRYRSTLTADAGEFSRDLTQLPSYDIQGTSELTKKVTNAADDINWFDAPPPETVITKTAQGAPSQPKGEPLTLKKQQMPTPEQMTMALGHAANKLGGVALDTIDKLGKNIHGFMNSEPGSEENVAHAVNIIRDILPIGAARSMIKGERATELGSFGGRKATGYAQAEAEGRTYKGHEGADKFEFSNADLDWANTVRVGGWPTVKGNSIQDLIRSPELFKQYPELSKVKIKLHDIWEKHRGMFDEETNTIHIARRGIGTATGRETIVHEIQHWIQKEESFARGGSMRPMVEEFAAIPDQLFSIGEKIGKLDKETLKQLPSMVEDFKNMPNGPALVDSIADSLQRTLHFSSHPGEKVERIKDASAAIKYLIENKLTRDEHYNFIRDLAHQVYKRLAGETEARNASKRLYMTEGEKIEQPPASTEDYPKAVQTLIYRFNHSIESLGSPGRMSNPLEIMRQEVKIAQDTFATSKQKGLEDPELTRLRGVYYDRLKEAFNRLSNGRELDLRLANEAKQKISELEKVPYKAPVQTDSKFYSQLKDMKWADLDYSKEVYEEQLKKLKPGRQRTLIENRLQAIDRELEMHYRGLRDLPGGREGKPNDLGAKATYEELLGMSTLETARGRPNEVQLLKSRIRQIDYDLKGKDIEQYPRIKHERTLLRNRLKELK